METAKETVTAADFLASDKFFFSLVKNIAKEEGISLAELEAIAGLLEKTVVLTRRLIKLHQK